jgi:hypothetical protein
MRQQIRQFKGEREMGRESELSSNRMTPVAKDMNVSIQSLILLCPQSTWLQLVKRIFAQTVRQFLSRRQPTITKTSRQKLVTAKSCIL